MVFVLALICAGFIWHIYSWHNSGRYAEMADWIGTTKGILKIAYDLTITVVFACVLGLLFGKITDIILKK